MGESAPELEALVRDELSGPVPEAAGVLGAKIAERLGPGTAAVVFYGSCLRKSSSEGVLDFYAIVDSYASVFASPILRWLGNIAPPTVVYLEAPHAGAVLRAKYAVMSALDFAHATSPAAVRPGIWARFCQPARVVYTRDTEALETMVQGGVRATTTAVQLGLPLVDDTTADAGFETLWQRIFRETYACEMRIEPLETIAMLYANAPERYDRAAACALRALAARGEVDVEEEDSRLRAILHPETRRRARRAWRLRRRAAQLAYATQLLKSTFTFGDWVPYALWKLERHSGTRLEPSSRQRRHPLIFGWPLLWKALRTREAR